MAFGLSMRAALGLAGMSVAAQARELARLDEASRVRRLSERETAVLAELTRLDCAREWDRAKRLRAQRERALARVAQIETRISGVAV